MARFDAFSPLSRSPSRRLDTLFLDSSPDVQPAQLVANKLRPVGTPISSSVIPIVPNSLSRFNSSTSSIPPQNSFRERHLRLRGLEEEKSILIEELIRQHEADTDKFSQMALRLDQEIQANQECRSREETLDAELGQIRRILDQNVYVTLLIDGDDLFFTGEYIKKGLTGGKEAAEALLTQLRTYATENLTRDPDFKIQAKIYLHKVTLCDHLKRAGIIDRIEELKDFLRGLMMAEEGFEVVDTSLDPGLTKKLLSRSLGRDYLNIHCDRVILAAGNDHSYAELFRQFSSPSTRQRVSFLQPNHLSQPKRLFDGNVPVIQLDGVLTEVPNGRVSSITLSKSTPTIIPEKLPSTKLAVVQDLQRVESGGSIDTYNTQSNDSAPATPAMTWAKMSAKTFVPATITAQAATSRPATPSLVSATKPVPLNNLTTIPRNAAGQRVDPIDKSLDYQELNRMKSMKLCNVYYLQGKSFCPDASKCGHNHKYELKKKEIPLLTEVARMTPCYYKLDCDDPGCIYGHRCPQSKVGSDKCFFKENCRFLGWGHGIDEKVTQRTKPGNNTDRK